MDQLEKIIHLDNEIQAHLVDAVLTQRNIPHVIRSYYDLAFDGLFQNFKGWGYIEAPKEFAEEVIEIVNQIKSENQDLNTGEIP